VKETTHWGSAKH